MQKPKFEIGDYVITNKKHHEDGHAYHGSFLKKLRNPTKILDVINNGEGENPISYIMDSKTIPQINEIFLTKEKDW